MELRNPIDLVTSSESPIRAPVSSTTSSEVRGRVNRCRITAEAKHLQRLGRQFVSGSIRSQIDVAENCCGCETRFANAKAQWPAVFDSERWGSNTLEFGPSLRCPRSQGDAFGLIHGSLFDATTAAGERVTTNSEPSPTLLVTKTWPWCASTTALTRLRPKPRPRWDRLLSPR
jgi:hypothetical protein